MLSVQTGSTPLRHLLANSLSELVQDHRLRQEPTNRHNEAIQWIAARRRLEGDFLTLDI